MVFDKVSEEEIQKEKSAMLQQVHVMCIKIFYIKHKSMDTELLFFAEYTN